MGEIKKILIIIIPLLLILSYNNCGKVQFSNTTNSLNSNDPPTICSPFGNGGGGQANNGLVASSIHYLGADQYDISGNTAVTISSFSDIWTKSDSVEKVNVFMNSINNPDHYWTSGFITSRGQELTLSNGTPILQYFSFVFLSNLVLGSLQPGNYQLAVLSDDAANITLTGALGNNTDLVLKNDGMHSMTMACASNTISLDSSSSFPLELDYADGPPVYTGVIIMTRPISPGESLSYVQCGKPEGDGYFFDQNGTPTPNYTALLNAGWAPLAPTNYVLPSSHPVNPCAD